MKRPDGWPLLSALLAGGILLHSLENYSVHSDCGFGVLLVATAGIFVNIFVIVRACKAENLVLLACAALALLLCTGVGIIANRIPFCTVCDGVSREDLGFLARWIRTDRC